MLLGCSEKQDNTAKTPQCLPSQSQCDFDSKFGRVNILFDQHKLVAEHDFNLLVNIPDNADVQVRGFMEGKSMYMGKIPLIFNKQDDGTFIANSIFGSCGEPNMVWRVNVEIVGQNQITQSLVFSVNSYLR